MANKYEIGLRERCKLVIWMDQLQCPEIVQLRYKKEFQKEPPLEDWITELYHSFMKTGSVWSISESPLKNENRKDTQYKQTDDIFSELEIYSDLDQLNINKMTRIKIEHSNEGGEKNGVEGYNELGEGIELFATEDDNDDKSFCNLLSVVKCEDMIGEENPTEIYVNGEETVDLGFLNDAFLCSSCGYETVDEKSFADHQKAHAKKDYFKCSRCFFTSNSTTLFRTHKKNCKRNRENETDFNLFDNESESLCHTCDQCGKAYSSFSSLKMHQAYHSKLRPFACDKCDYRFYSEKSLKKHLVTHDKIKHLECPHCSFKCNLSGNMIIHARTHTGEKPYKCPECPYRTGNPSTIKRHIANHRNELIYRCRKCNYKTSKSSLLANHEKSHSLNQSEFKCHICLEQLRNAYALRYHMTKMHSEQEILECPFCYFRQKDESLLKIHIRRHTGEKPYSCNEENCDFRAMRSQDLRKHTLKVHCSNSHLRT